MSICSFAGDLDEDYQETELDIMHPAISSILKKETFFLADISNIASVRLSDFQKITDRGWRSLLCATLKTSTDIFGMLEIFTTEMRYFEDWEIEVFKIFSQFACQAFREIKLINSKKAFRDLNQSMLNIMTTTSTKDDVFKLLLRGAMDSVGCPYGIVSCLNSVTGMLDVMHQDGYPKYISKLKLGEGISGTALIQEKSINVLDIESSKWNKAYVEGWEDTRSELAIPILIDNVPIRVGKEINKNGKKRIGVLNLESPKPSAFSEEDIERLEVMTRCAAIRLESIELNRKHAKLRGIERAINRSKDQDEFMEILAKGIHEILGFKWVNISFVNFERTIIKSEYVVGLSKRKAQEFKAEAKHSLESEDIQSCIVKNKKIEVPRLGDKRFDRSIFRKYGHEKLVRGYIPIIELLSSQVIGTIEVGYQREYVPYIYEQDIQILKNFVDDAARVLERSKSMLIDTITHECIAPIVSIRSNASFSQRHISQLSYDRLTLKYNDILTDCDLLLHQINQIEYAFGRQPRQKPKFMETVVFRDVVIKTVYPIISGLRFPSSNIQYNRSDSNRIVVYTDKALLNQVVYNIVINSIKYCEPDRSTFRLVLGVDEDAKTFTIKFQDWGIGINRKHQKYIFDQGFRSPEAKAKNINGSGLGLFISKKIMHQLGGDLRLFNGAKPTEFHLILPKILERVN